MYYLWYENSTKDCFYSLLDGEHIKYDKNGKILNMYAAFDIYYKNKKSLRDLEFIKTNDSEKEELEEESNRRNEQQYRLNLLYEFTRDLKCISIVEKTSGEVNRNTNNKNLPMLIKCKEFYQDNDEMTIFDGCSKILSNESDGLFEYNTDGLIFTPARLPVAGNVIGGLPGPLKKYTWEHSFKWKPPQYNTVDFLVSVKKDKTGKDEIHNIFQEGINMQSGQRVLQYKSLILRCGFDEKKHGYLNPFNDMIHDNISTIDDIDNEETYQPVPFQPTNPSDINASICNIFLKNDGSTSYMTTEEGEVF